MRIVLFFLLTVGSHAYGQNVLYRKVIEAERQTRMRSYDLFSVSDRPDTRLPSPGSLKKPLQLNGTMVQRILLENPKHLSFRVPFNNGDLTVKLMARPVLSPDFSIKDAHNIEVFNQAERYYGGIIEGDSNSLVAVTISERGVSAYLYGESGNYHLGSTNEDGEYVLKEAESSLATLSCAVSDTTGAPVPWEPAMNLRSSSTEFVNCNPVQVYFEVDYSLYLTAGTMERAIAATTDLFNRVALVFENENINMALWGIRIWDTPDPYQSLQGGMQVFNDFTNRMYREPKGEVAHLLTARNFTEFSGLAQLIDLCDRNIRMGLNAGLNLNSGSLGSIPHEIGHNLGVYHTHSCRWPGGPIDNCWFPEDGTCNQGPPANGNGTIMSYCSGDVIRNGFGVLPGNLLRKMVAQCWGPHEQPVALRTPDLRGNSVKLAWKHSVIDASFEVEYRSADSAEWRKRTVKDTTVVIGELLPETRYLWRVRTACSASVEGEFRTTSAPGYCLPEFTRKGGCTYRMQKGAEYVMIDNHQLDLFRPCDEPYYYSDKSMPDLGSGEHSVTVYYGPWYTSGLQISIWLDLDGNGFFEKEENVYYHVGIYTGVITGSFKIPEGLSTPSTRMRLSILSLGYSEESLQNDPCGQYTSGFAIDYRVNVVECGEEDRLVVRNLQAMEMDGRVTRLSWESASGKAFIVEYRMKYAEEWTSVPCRGNSLTLADLDPGATYEWRVKAACGDYTSSEFTAPRERYCVPVYLPGNYNNCVSNGTGIRRFTVEGTTLNQVSECAGGGVELFSSNPATLKTGVTYTFRIQFMNAGYFMKAAIWIDINNNGVFDTNERFFFSREPIQGELTGQFTLPARARTTKNTRMRVTALVHKAADTACDVEDHFGETEDYVIHIEDPCGEWLKGDFAISHGTTCEGGKIEGNTSLPEGTPVVLRIGNWGESETVNLTAYVENGKVKWRNIADGIYRIHSATVNGCTTLFDTFVYISRPQPVFRLELIRHMSMCDLPSGTLGFVTNLDDGIYNFGYQLNDSTFQTRVEVKERWALFKPDRAGIYRNFTLRTSACVLVDQSWATVTAPGKPDVSAANSGPYYAGETIQLTASGGVDYFWRGPDGFSSDLQHPEIRLAKVVNSGTYTVTVKDAKNCGNAAVTEVEVIPVLGLETEEWVKVYPNPVADVLFVQVPYHDESEAVIYSIDGRELKQVLFKEKTEIRVEPLGAGNYILKVRNGSRTYVTRLNVL